MTANRLRRSAGVTLIELMVALAIGSFLMLGALTVFMQSRTSFRVNESVSRLQESARFVIDVMEPDVRMASYFGLTSRSSKIENSATPLDVIPAGLDVAGDCGQNWTIDLSREVDGTNNGYGWACAAFGTGAQPQADTLVVHRVTEDPIALALLDADTMYMQSARFRDSQLFVGAAVPAGFLAVNSQTHALMVAGYYVSQNSSLDTPGNPVPSLRMKLLLGGAPGPRLDDREILPGVEDFQIQFGVDTDILGAVNRGSVDRYVNPGDPIITFGAPGFLPNAEILSVRIWLRIRAERPENGFTDTTDYVYADQDVPAFNDQFRRTIVTRTIYLRNARGQV